mmetsp:Transcript_81768/g.205741  ORF Transcript_81768/g.205741 Transcript_81768/m.205741 type:complete len:272 (-) Transcript_81768:45-860(-)
MSCHCTTSPLHVATCGKPALAKENGSALTRRLLLAPAWSGDLPTFQCCLHDTHGSARGTSSICSDAEPPSNSLYPELFTRLVTASNTGGCRRDQDKAPRRHVPARSVTETTVAKTPKTQQSGLPVDSWAARTCTPPLNFMAMPGTYCGSKNPRGATVVVCPRGAKSCTALEPGADHEAGVAHGSCAPSAAQVVSANWLWLAGASTPLESDSPPRGSTTSVIGTRPKTCVVAGGVGVVANAAIGGIVFTLPAGVWGLSSWLAWYTSRPRIDQ